MASFRKGTVLYSTSYSRAPYPPHEADASDETYASDETDAPYETDGRMVVPSLRGLAEPIGAYGTATSRPALLSRCRA